MVPGSFSLLNLQLSLFYQDHCLIQRGHDTNDHFLADDGRNKNGKSGTMLCMQLLESHTVQCFFPFHLFLITCSNVAAKEAGKFDF